MVARARRAKQDPPAIRPAGQSRRSGRSGRQPVEHSDLGERREAVRHSPVLDDAAVHDTAHVDHDATAAIVMLSPPAATIDIRPPRQYPVVPIADPLTSG